MGRPGGGTSIQLLNNKFHRAGAHVVDGACGGHGGFAHLAAQGFCHAGGGGFFEHFLVAPLHRAVALEQVNIVALRVAKDLDLDVARALRVFLDQHRVVAKAVDGFAPAGGQGCGEVFGFVHGAHALAAATGTGLDQHRVTNAVGFALQERRVLVAAVVTGHQRHAGFFHELLRLGLQTHGLYGRGRRADEDQAGFDAGTREFFVLAQKTVARVNRFGTGGAGSLDDAFPTQITLAGGAAADVHGLVASGHVFGVGIGVRVHRHRLDGHAPGCGRDAAGDLTAVGDQDFFEHAVFQTRGVKPASQAGAFAKRTANLPCLHRWRVCRQCGGRCLHAAPRSSARR